MNSKIAFICVCCVLLGGLCSAAGQELRVDLDASAVPELTEWGQDAKELVMQWHPRISHLLATKGYEPTQSVQITLRKSNRGIADTSAGSHIRISSGWIEQHPEDIGLVVHELVHVIQGYGHGAQGWLCEGIADYIRWAIYEGKPQEWFSVSDQPNGYLQSYQVTGGFLLWLESDRAPGIVKKLNTSLRNRQYDASIFEDETGLSLETLWSTYVQERKQTVATAQIDWQLGPFVRPVNKPVITPQSETVFDCPMTQQTVSWESSDTFNPAAVVFQDQICVLYRAEDGSGDGIGGHTSRIGLAMSEDGVTFDRRKTPVFYPADDDMKGYEWQGGCEDPRVVESAEGTFYMYYTMWNRDNPAGIKRSARIGVASSKDLIHWKKHGPIFKDVYNDRFLDSWHKAASVITSVQDGRLKAVKINGTYWMYWGENKICAATSDDLIHWEPVVDKKQELVVLIRPRNDKFDSLLTEAGPPAVMTDEGIVLLYNGKNSGADRTIGKGAYAAGQLLLDANDPIRILARSDNYFFKPEEEFEKSGQYLDGTVFIEGLVYYKNKWYLYYGTADSYVGVAVCESKS